MLPFKKFIIAMLFFNKDVSFISNKLGEFGYHADEDEIADVLTELYTMLPPSIVDWMKNRQILDLNDETHVQWLKHFDLFEFYHYTIMSGKHGENPPPYFKWYNDCVWIHSYRDVMSMVNIFLFNEESIESISDIVMFKYRKKISFDALTRYKSLFWNTADLSAKEAFKYCSAFRNNAMIIRNLRSGGQEVEVFSNSDSVDEKDNGSDVPMSFHDSEYIKWKIGYRKLEVPTPGEFLDRIKQDAQFKYYEAMNMTQHIDIEEEEGDNAEFGSFSKKMTKRKNVEEARAKMVKAWLDMYLKAHVAAPTGDSNKNAEFFAKMNQLELNFGGEEEKIASIDQNPGMLEDIKGDISKGVL